MKKCLFSAFITLFSFQLNSQSPIELGLFLGASVYNGDIDVNVRNFLPQTRPAGGVFARYHLLPAFAVRGQFNITTLYADEAKYPVSDYRKQRGFSFETDVKEVVLQGEWHFLGLSKNFSLDSDNPFISLFGFGGVSGVFFNPTTDFNEPNPIYESINEDKTTDYSKKTLTILGGGGIKVMLDKRTSLGAELSLRRTNSDYLDGISKIVNSQTPDYFLTTGITFTRTFGGDDSGSVKYAKGSKNSRRFTKCPKF